MNIFVNIGIYQAVWFMCVFLENLGALLSIPLLILHLYLSPCKIQDAKQMGTLLLAGIIIDGTLHMLGFISYNVPAYPIPLWLATIWLGLATLPHHSLSWLKGRMLLASLFGALGGPLAYWAGVRVGAASFNWSLIQSLTTLAVIWAILWPLAMYIAGNDLAKNGSKHSTSIKGQNNHG